MLSDGRDFYEKKIETLLCIMVEKLKCENGCGKAAYNKTAETIMCGLLNKMYRYGFTNANTAGRPNFPGIDLISSDRQLGVQITTENSLAKVDHTLQMVRDHEECSSIRRLIILILTFDKPKAAMTARKSERWFNGKEDIWSLRKIVTDLQSDDTDVLKLEEIAGFLEREIGGVTSEPAKQILFPNSLQANAPGGENEESAEETTKNIDDELEEKFKELFDTPGKSENTSSLKQKILEKKSQNFMLAIDSRLQKSDQDDSDDIAASLVPARYGVKTTAEVLFGKHFTLPDLPGYKTIVFQVNRVIDYKTLTSFYDCVLLDSSQDEAQDGSGAETTYYMDEPHENGDQCLILHFGYERGEVYINSALLIDFELFISKTPVLFNFSSVIADEDLLLSTSSFNLDAISEEELNQVGRSNVVQEDKWYNAKIGENLTFLIDPETATPVKREIYYDNDKNEWKARVKLTPYKQYFAFQIRGEAQNSTRVPLTELKIAKSYKDGLFGFPRDVLKAAEYFEKDGSAEAFYEIADIFRTDPSLQDREAYLEYMSQAIEFGCEDAAVELIADMLLTELPFDPSELEELLKKAEQKTNITDFLLGYATEKGILAGTTDTAFLHYHKSAEGGYKPACVRLGITKVQKGDEDHLRRRFMKSLDDTRFLPEYCMGCVLFFGLGIRPQQERGIALLEVAAQNGNKQAVDALYQIYDADDVYEDKEKALTWLKVIEKNNPSFSNELANRLIDGIGCAVCDENDRLAFAILQKASQTGNKTAIHNLGWMYKKGRGCEVDYDLALQLFLKAEKANSLLHIGDMYEQGLGVPADLNMAVFYYEKGAEQGSKKATERLEELKFTTAH